MKRALIAIAALPAALRWATVTVREAARLALTLCVTAAGASALAWLAYAIWKVSSGWD